MRYTHSICGISVIVALACLMMTSVPTATATGEPDHASADLSPVDTNVVSIVTNGPIEVRTILSSLADNAGFGLQMAADVSGLVNLHLENVSLEHALTAVLDPLQLGFEWMDGVIVVSSQTMITRWLTFDYPVTEREGRGELQVSAGNRGSGGGGGGGGGGNKNENKSQISSSLVMSIWPDVMQALVTLVFKGAELASGQDKNSTAISLADNEGRTLIANPMASIIQVTAERERVHQVEELIKRLTQSLQRQVAIEVKIIEVALDADTQAGINWSILGVDDVDPSLTTFDSGEHIANEYFQFIVEKMDVSGVLEAIAMSGDLRTIATPRVTTLNNQKAVVRIVREEVYYLAQVEPGIVANGVATEAVVNYTPQTVSVGVVLDVTPQVGADGVITMNVHPTISDVIAIAESPNKDTAPILSVRELDTVGKIRDGETLVLAGLMSERTKLTKTGIPLLKDLPLLGYLFGKTRKQTYNIELVVMLTPVILESGAPMPWSDLTEALEVAAGP